MAGSPLVGRGVRFRYSPSSALRGQTTQVQTSGNPWTPVGGWLANRPVNTTAPAAGPYVPSGGTGMPNMTPFGSIPPNVVGTAAAAGASRGAAQEAYEELARKYSASVYNAQQFIAPNPADEAAVEAEYAIREKEAAMRQAELDGDYVEAARLKVEIASNKMAMQSGIRHTGQMAQPQIEKALAYARNINDRNAPPIAVNTSTNMQEVDQAYDSARGQVTQTSELLMGSGEAALAAAMKIASEDEDLYMQQSFSRDQHARNIVGFTQDVATSGVQVTAANFKRRMIEEQAMDKQHWADEDRAIAQMFEDLGRRKEGLALDAERDRLNKENDLRSLIPDQGDFEATNAFDTGSAAAEDYISTAMAGQPAHRANFMDSVLEGMFANADFIKLQDLSPAAVRKFLTEPIPGPENDADGNPIMTTRATANGLSSSEVRIISDAMGIYNATVSTWSPTKPSATPGGPGTGPRGQEANNLNPGNLAAAKAGTGPYGARVQFIEQQAPSMAEAYNLRPDGIGYFRPASESVGSERSSNSDHITAGAVDFHGTNADMQAALKDFQTRPYVSFAKVHGDPLHLHVSFDVGYFS